MKKRKVYISTHEAALIRHFKKLKERWGDSKPPKLYPDQNY